MPNLSRKRSGMVAGVAAGLGAHLDIDPALIRLAFVLFTVFSGFGLVAYFILWIILPYEDQGTAATPETIRSGAEEIAAKARAFGDSLRDGRGSANRNSLLLGGSLILLGLIFLLRNLHWPWLQWINARTLWPLILIALGGYLLFDRTRGE